jgi:hypothetical protein
MMRSRHLVAASPARRVGVALPTALAAVLCGGSVLAIVVSGALALDDGGPVALRLPVSQAPPGAEATTDSAADTTASAASGAAATSTASVIPPAGPLRDGRGVVPTVVRPSLPTMAPTAEEHSIAMPGGGGGAAAVPASDRAMLGSGRAELGFDRVIAAAVPSPVTLGRGTRLSTVRLSTVRLSTVRLSTVRLPTVRVSGPEGSALRGSAAAGLPAARVSVFAAPVSRSGPKLAGRRAAAGRSASRRRHRSHQRGRRRSSCRS